MSKIKTVRLEDTSPDGLEGSTWFFSLMDDQLVVDVYCTWSRPTKRHNPRVVSSWSRLDSRTSSLKQEQVPFTPEVAARAFEAWMKLVKDTVTVGFWKR